MKAMGRRGRGLLAANGQDDGANRGNSSDEDIKAKRPRRDVGHGY